MKAKGLEKTGGHNSNLIGIFEKLPGHRDIHLEAAALRHGKGQKTIRAKDQLINGFRLVEVQGLAVGTFFFADRMYRRSRSAPRPFD